jgi:hypothetical protein
MIWHAIYCLELIASQLWTDESRDVIVVLVFCTLFWRYWSTRKTKTSFTRVQFFGFCAQIYAMPTRERISTQNERKTKKKEKEIFNSLTYKLYFSILICLETIVEKSQEPFPLPPPNLTSRTCLQTNVNVCNCTNLLDSDCLCNESDTTNNQTKCRCEWTCQELWHVRNFTDYNMSVACYPPQFNKVIKQQTLLFARFSFSH